MSRVEVPLDIHCPNCSAYLEGIGEDGHIKRSFWYRTWIANIKITPDELGEETPSGNPHKKRASRRLRVTCSTN